MKQSFYYPFTDHTNENNLIVYVRDEDSIPVMIWNFFGGEERIGFLHILFEMSDEDGKDCGVGSLMKKIIFNEEFNYEEIKSNIGTIWTTTDDYNLLSFIQEEKLVGMYDDEYFNKRIEVLNNLIENGE
jgi:hypothetical protein